MTDRQQRLTDLLPGVRARPEGVVLRGARVARTRRHGRLNPVELLWFVGAFVVVFEFSAHFLFNKPSRPAAPFVVTSKPQDSPARNNLAIWPIVGKQYPSLRRHWDDYAGTRYVAVPDLFWKSMLSAEKTQLAGDLDVVFPARNWVVVTGPYRGRGQMALREVHERSELVASTQAVAATQAVTSTQAVTTTQTFAGTQTFASIAEAEIPEPAPAPEADRVAAARTALAADPIVEEPAVASGESERPSPPPGFPKYEILFQTDDPLGRRVYAEVLVPALSPHTPKQHRRQVSRTIAKLEGLDDLTLYCTRQAHEAHYSMDYADRHPEALARGLLGSLERGRFKPYNPR